MKPFNSHGLLAVLPAFVGVLIELVRQGNGPLEAPEPSACPDCFCGSHEVISWLKERDSEKAVLGFTCFLGGVICTLIVWAACRRYGQQAGLAPRRRGGGVLVAR